MHDPHKRGFPSACGHRPATEPFYYIHSPSYTSQSILNPWVTLPFESIREDDYTDGDDTHWTFEGRSSRLLIWAIISQCSLFLKSANRGLLQMEINEYQVHLQRGRVSIPHTTRPLLWWLLWNDGELNPQFNLILASLKNLIQIGVLGHDTFS